MSPALQSPLDAASLYKLLPCWHRPVPVPELPGWTKTVRWRPDGKSKDCAYTAPSGRTFRSLKCSAPPCQLQLPAVESSCKTQSRKRDKGLQHLSFQASAGACRGAGCATLPAG